MDKTFELPAEPDLCRYFFYYPTGTGPVVSEDHGWSLEGSGGMDSGSVMEQGDGPAGEPALEAGSSDVCRSLQLVGCGDVRANRTDPIDLSEPKNAPQQAHTGRCEPRLSQSLPGGRRVPLADRVVCPRAIFALIPPDDRCKNAPVI
jgi:hypothetical protein